jgi:peptide/nickel transport system substrate-binding protein
MRCRKGILTGAMLALLPLLASTAASAQKQGGTLRVFHRDSPANMSIHEEGTISVVAPMMPIFNNLVLFNQHEKQNRLDDIVPDLADSWSWSEDGKDLTFKLHQGVKWHDGKPFTAAEVKCTWDLLQGKAKEKLRLNAREAWWANLDNVTADNDYQATFHLKRPQPAFLAFLASGFTPVYPCHVSPAQMRQHPIGTGPFSLSNSSRTSRSRSSRTRTTGRRGFPISTGSNGRSFRTARRRCSPSWPASST